MALWLVRAGKYGEFEEHFLKENRICLTWDDLPKDGIMAVEDYSAVKKLLFELYPGESPKRISNWAGQIWAFVLPMKPKDWCVLPRKTKPAIAIGEILGPCAYDSKAEPQYRVYRDVKWLNPDVPRSAFGQDLLYSFGAFLTVCKIERNDAEARVRAMSGSGWKEPAKPATKLGKKTPDGDEPPTDEDVDLEQLARDQIASLLQRQFKGYGLARVVAAILQAQGYTVHVGAVGPDKGVDILAAPGPLGFGRPRICVQVKSGDYPIERAVLDQLVGVMQNVSAEQGLLVSWGGFKSSIDKETQSQFFRVRLWDAEDLVEQLLEQYDKLPADLRAEIPLKRIWVVAIQSPVAGDAV